MCPESIGRFVGIAIDNYQKHDPLVHAVHDLTELRALLEPLLPGDVEVDPTEARVREVLNDLNDAVPDGRALLVAWSGHGIRGIEGLEPLRLPAADSGRNATDGLGVAEIVGKCATSGAGQLLLLLDTCHAGAGVMPATAAGAAIQQHMPPDSKHVWVGVLTSCLSGDTAVDGLFGARLRSLLVDGPSDPHSQRRWSRHARFLRGDDLCDALLKDWDGDDQRPDFQARGSAWWMLPNPLYDRHAPEQVVEHLLRAARGSADGTRSWFTGREAEVDRVVRWVTSGEPGLHVVTGSAGTGKSAIVGRVVSLSNAVERDRLLGQQPVLDHVVPRVGSVTGHAHTRALTADRLAELLDADLVRAEIVSPLDEGRRNAAELVGALQRARTAGRDVPVLVVDGLDEARGEAFRIARELLLRLAPLAVVIVSTRDMPDPQEDAAVPLIATLSPVDRVDLDSPDARASGRSALRRYVTSRLSAVSAGMDAELVAEHLAAVTDETEQRPFLLARLVTDQLRASPVDTSLPGWQRHVSHSTESAFDVDLVRVEPPHHRARGDVPELARAMLTALTWTYGAGFPEDEWRAVATALAGTAVDRDDVNWVLDELGRYVVQDGEGGVAVYRMAHQSLADHLRKRHQPSFDEPFDPAAGPVADALLSRYRTLLEAGLRAEEPTYLWKYAWQHAASAGSRGIVVLRGLADINTSLAPDIALAEDHLATAMSAVERWDEAVASATEAVVLCRRLAEADPANYRTNLVRMLGNLGHQLSELGRWKEALVPTEEAVALCRELARANPAAHRLDLARMLGNLGNQLSEVGRREEAVALTEEAVTLCRELAEANPTAHLPNLARMLSNLGNELADVGRLDEALEPTEDAVTLYRELAATNSAHLPGLAMALINLGRSLQTVGRAAEALTPTWEAVTLYRNLAATNSAHLPGLAMALNNVGSMMSEMGRWDDALGLTEEALTLYRRLADAKPAAHRPGLGRVLNNLGKMLSEAGRREEALVPTEEAATLYRELADANPAAHLPGLAMALNNLGTMLSDVGRREEALAPYEEAVGLYRELADANPAAHVPGLAMALNNLGKMFSELGRPEALAPAEEAVTLFRELSDANPAAHLPGLARALVNLGRVLFERDQWDEAVEPTEEAVTLYRELAATNPGHLPHLAVALSNLGTMLSEGERLEEAVAPAEEAVTLHRELAATNSAAHLPGLARALINLGKMLVEGQRWAEALVPTEEAVTLCRELAEANPAVHVPNLAMALNNLGTMLSEGGRRAEALAPNEEAVTLYRALVDTNPAVHLSGLAMALDNLRDRLSENGIAGAFDDRWQRVAVGLDDVTRAVLLVDLVQRSSDDDRGFGVPRLVEALELAPQIRDVVAEAHDAARSLRTSDREAMDAAWRSHTGSTPPSWLTVDEELLALAQEWVDSPTFEAERDLLAANPVLLEEISDVAVDEAVLPLPPGEAERMLDLRTTARQVGVHDAYHPLLMSVLAGIFAGADPALRRRLLQEQGAELRDPLVHDVLQAAVDDEPAHVGPALALLTVADNAPELLPAVLDAVDTPAAFAALFEQSPTPEVLLAVTTLALSEGDDPTALLWQAIAHIECGDRDAAVAAVTSAFTTDPGQRDDWIALLAARGARNTAALTLVPVLLALDVEPVDG